MQKNFLGVNGCLLNAGRYPECTRFICLRIVQNAFKDPYEKIYYYGISNLLSGISNTFMGRYHLFDLSLEQINTEKGRRKLSSRINEAKKIFDELENFRKIITSANRSEDSSEIRNYVLKLWELFPYAAKSMYIMREPTISLESFYE
jgi:ketol-acid reductoisomerase